VLDEAYCDLLPLPQWQPALLKSGNLLILRSMTKAMGLAGLRLGYVLGCEELIGILRAAKAPWNVNACAQEAGVAALSDGDHYAKTLALLREQKQALVDGLTQQGWQVLPSAAAFFLLYAGDGAGLKGQLLAQGCLVRDCASFGLPQYVRISPRHAEQNRRLLAAFATLSPAPVEEA
jgi:histidinol-phosphate aminotransferase